MEKTLPGSHGARSLSGSLGSLSPLGYPGSYVRVFFSVSVIIPPALYGFELFFGTIQAYVFFLLAVVFISGALVSHHGDDHPDEHH